MITASYHPFIESPWTEIEPIRLGNVPPGLGTPDLYLTVSNDDVPFLRIDLYCDSDEIYNFNDVVVWKQFITIGFGYKVYLVPLEDRQFITIDLGSYFGYLYPYGDVLLIASGQRLFCVNPLGEMNWTSEPVGIDGVVIDKIDGQIIYGSGEWDPEGGWKPFTIELDTGQSIDL